MPQVGETMGCGGGGDGVARFRLDGATAAAEGIGTVRRVLEREMYSISCAHGRSRMTIDPRIPTNPVTEHVGFLPTRHRHWLHQARSAVR